MLIDRGQIETLIPHANPMCLLDGVIHWDETRIRCVSQSHRDEKNPLRNRGRLNTICSLEYAAQAMAVHGGLAGTFDRRSKSGYLVAVRNLRCHTERIDTLTGDLVVDAERLLGDERRVVYGFSVRSGEKDLLTGRAVVVLEAGRE